LSVLEQVIIQNQTSPPRAYVNPQGTYLFSLPQAATGGVRVTVHGPGGMPIPQTPVPREGQNRYAIEYPIRPGETQIRVEYGMDYTQPFVFEKPIDLASEQTHIVTTGGDVQVEGDGITALPADPSTGFMGYLVTQPGTMLRVSVSGEAALDPTAQTAVPDGEDGSTLVPIQAPVTRQRVWVFAALGLLLLGGFVYLYRR
jgi:hypothetical protein